MEAEASTSLESTIQYYKGHPLALQLKLSQGQIQEMITASQAYIYRPLLAQNIPVFTMKTGLKKCTAFHFS